MTTDTLLVISARLSAHGATSGAAPAPRRDYLELARELQADVIDYDTVEDDPILRKAWRLAGMPAAQALAAFRRRGRYACIYSDGEHIGIPLALLLRGGRSRPRHVTIGHLLDTSTKAAVFRWLRPRSGLDRILLHSTYQRQRIAQRLGLGPDICRLVPYHADVGFWRPDPATAAEDLICSAGLEYRDYDTFLAAVEGLPARTVIAAASHWSKHRNQAQRPDLPQNVEVAAFNYAGLRALYDRARFVVVPLKEVSNQAGITTVLEAMAMAKAVIVTATRGQGDVVRGRICTATGPAGPLHGGPEAFGVPEHLAAAETGLYVPPGDPLALRAAIDYLLAHPAEAERMGTAGRRLVSGAMSLDHFVGRVSNICLELASERAAGADVATAPSAPYGR